MVLATTKLSHITPSAISDRSSGGELKKKKSLCRVHRPAPSDECWIIRLSWKQMIGIHRDPTSCCAAQFLVGIDKTAISFCCIFRLSLHPCFLFLGPAAWFSRVLPCLLSFVDILKNFSMLPFFSFRYAACVLTTSVSVSCLGLFQSLVFFCVPSMCFHFSVPCIGEGNGTPLQCSCLENPRDGRAWWAAISGVAQGHTRLKRLSSSSSSSRVL